MKPTVDQVVMNSQNQVIMLGKASPSQTRQGEYNIDIVVYSTQNVGGEGRRPFSASDWRLGRGQYTLLAGSPTPHDPFNFRTFLDPRDLEKQANQIHKDLCWMDDVFLRSEPKPFTLARINEKGEIRPLDPDNVWSQEMIIRIQEAARFQLNSIKDADDKWVLSTMIGRLEELRERVSLEAWRRALSPFDK